jgi:hypothetical protein
VEEAMGIQLRALVEIDAGPREGLTTAEREESTKLGQDVRVLDEDRDIL